MIYILGDTHLSFSVDKPMDIFGAKWENYVDKLKENWIKKITDEDTVFIAGDISWAMTLEEAYADLKFLNDLPGKKILTKGNHDYWWNSLTKMKAFCNEMNLDKIQFMYNNAFEVEGINFYGTRGWQFNKPEEFTNIRREYLRLSQSIEDIKDKENVNICIMHYPPYIQENERQAIIKQNKLEDEEEIKKCDYIELMKSINTKICFYGHLHGMTHKKAITDTYYNDVYLSLISGDYIDFNPLCINELLNKIER